MLPGVVVSDDEAVELAEEDAPVSSSADDDANAVELAVELAPKVLVFSVPAPKMSAFGPVRELTTYVPPPL